jgi:hypothetical protein
VPPWFWLTVNHAETNSQWAQARKKWCLNSGVHGSMLTGRAVFLNGASAKHEKQKARLSGDSMFACMLRTGRKVKKG